MDGSLSGWGLCWYSLGFASKHSKQCRMLQTVVIEFGVCTLFASICRKVLFERRPTVPPAAASHRSRREKVGG